MIDLIAATLALWGFFIVVAGIVDRHRETPFTGIKKVLAYVVLTVFIIFDVVYNYTYGAILFCEFASNDRKTLTARLKHYVRTEPETWRGKLALFMCKYMIDPWDPGHCGLK